MPEDTYLSVNQVALLLKVHHLTIRRYIKEGRLKAVRLGGNVRIPQSSLDSFSHSIEPSPLTTPKAERQKKIVSFNLDDPLFRMKGRGMSMKAWEYKK